MTPQAMSGSLFGLGAISSIIGGVGSYESGQGQKAADDYNAQVTLENMQDQIVANQQKTSALVGRQASSYAASGVDIASGSPLLVMAATQARGAQKGEQIREQGTEQATLEQYYGKMAAFQGTMTGISTFLTGLTKSSTAYYGATAPSPTPTAPPANPPIGYGSGW
jgi:hypothetical protein